MHLRFNRILDIVLSAQALPLICGLVIIALLQQVTINTDHATKSEEEALVALKSSSAVQRVLLRGVASLAQYAQTNDEADLQPYYESRQLVITFIKRLQQLKSSYPFEAKTIDGMEQIASTFSSMGNEMIALQRLGESQFASDRLAEVRQACEQACLEWSRLNEELTDSLQRYFKLSPLGRASYVSTLSRILLVGLLAVFFACVITSRLLTKYIASRLLVIQENSRRLTEGKPLLARLSGSDEIATLDREFHSMAAAIAEATAREKDILQNATDAILTLDEDLKIASANPACARLWGNDAQLIGRPLADIVESQHSHHLLSVLESVKKSLSGTSIELPLSHCGQPMFVSLSVQWSPADRLFSCIVHDITVQKQAEEAVRQSQQRLDAILEEMPAGMVLSDDEGHVIRCNQVAARLVNKPKEAIVGALLGTIFPAAEQPVAWLENTAVAGRAAMTVGDGADARQIELNVNRVAYAGRSVFLIVMLDTTANQKIELLRAQLIDSISKSIVVPLKHVSDVLTDVNSYAEKRADERFSKFTIAATQESNRLLKLFSELLEVEGSKVQQMSVQKRPVAVQELFARSVAAANATAESRGIKVSFDETDAFIEADPDRMVQVLVNLIFNAIKFTPRGGYVKLQAKESNSGSLDICVLDSGSGIPAGLEQAIFEPFRQTKASDAVLKGGSGLGLFICKSLVEKHGGTISAGNHADGAVFTITLPAAC